MFRPWIKIALCLFFGLLLFSCDKKSDRIASDEADTHTAPFITDRNDIISFTPGEGSFFYAVTLSEGLGKYTTRGERVEAYENPKILSQIVYADGFIYAVDKSKRQLIAYDLDSKALRTMSEGLFFMDIRAMAVIDGVMYLIIIPTVAEPGTLPVNEKGFVNYDEVFVTMDIQKGEITPHRHIENPISLYYASDQNLYMYSYKEDTYMLSVVNRKTNTLTRSTELSETRYFTSFALEDDHLIYWYYDKLNVRNMKTNVNYTMRSGVVLFPDTKITRAGSYIYFINGLNLKNYYDLAEELKTELTLLYVQDGEIHDLHSVTQTDEAGEVSAPPYTQTEANNVPILPVIKDKVIISYPPSKDAIDLNALGSELQLTVVYSEQPSELNLFNEFLTSVMAGDSGIDIYMFYSNNPVLRAMKSQKNYVPLNGDPSVEGYLDKCHGWIKDSALNEGDIWALPVYFDACALWYVPENMAVYGMDVNAFADYFDYLAEVNRMNEIKEDKNIFAVYPYDILMMFQNQYDLHYRMDYKTDLFARLFDSWWTGWKLTGAPTDSDNNHPILGADRAKFFKFFESGDSHGATRPDMDGDTLICKLDFISLHLGKLMNNVTVGPWRVAPLPKVSGEIDKNHFFAFYLVINPNGTQMDEAIRCVSAIAENPLGLVTRPIFPYKNPADYEGYYDTERELFNDLFAIYQNGEVNDIPAGIVNMNHSDFR
jgi:ABC-type glycerol-3-phosphate transport system substrate-binding protein